MATKTINLTGAEVAVTGLSGAHAHIRNDGTEVIYAAKTAGITAGADGVASIPAGQSDTIRGISGAVYLLGTGSALIQSDDYVASPFKTSAQAGGSGADDVARAAINTHAGNAEIHVTAAEKTAWDGKAELTDIPTTLPADGGNADTAKKVKCVDVIGASDTILDWANSQGECSASAFIIIAGGFPTDAPAEAEAVVKVDADPQGDRKIVTWTCYAGGSNISYTRSVFQGSWSGNWMKTNGADYFAQNRVLTTVDEVNDPNLESGIYSAEGASMMFPSGESLYYVLIVNKHRTNNAGFGSQVAIPYDGGNMFGVFYRNCAGGAWNSWRNVADNGDAATLGTHPVADFVLRTEYAELAARVAALENGGTT